MPFEEQILQVIKAVMPQNAEIRLIPGTEDLKVDVSWKLNNDPERPNKMSKTILICVSHEAAQDFASIAASHESTAYRCVTTFLSSKIAAFDPQHNAPRDEVPPIEKWVINSKVLCG